MKKIQKIRNAIKALDASKPHRDEYGYNNGQWSPQQSENFYNALATWQYKRNRLSIKL